MVHPAANFILNRQPLFTIFDPQAGSIDKRYGSAFLDSLMTVNKSDLNPGKIQKRYRKDFGLLKNNHHEKGRESHVPQYLLNLKNAMIQMLPQMIVAKALSALAGKAVICSYGLPVVGGISLLASAKHIYSDINSGKSTGLSLTAGIGQMILQGGSIAWSIRTRGFSDPVAGTEQVSILIYAFCRDAANYYFSLQNTSPSPASKKSTVASGLCYVSIMEFLGFCSGKPGELASSPEAKTAIAFLCNVIASMLTESFDNVNYATLAGWFSKTTPVLKCTVSRRESMSAEGFVRHMGTVFPGRLALLSTYNESMDKLKELPDGISKAAGTIVLFILYTTFTGAFLTKPEVVADEENPEESGDGRSGPYAADTIEFIQETIRQPKPRKVVTGGH